jgi:hypothetical protein
MSTPFTVTPPESCGVPYSRCLHPVWLSSVNNECSAFVSPGDTASVALGLVSPVDLAGLEGSLHVVGEGARIVGLETIGPAIGMQLSWTPTADGVRFVMFALQGAPIPGLPPIAPAIIPVLRIRVALSAQSSATRIEVGTRWDLLGSDIDGQPVPICPVRGTKPPVAVICVGRGECDYNADGLLDVRDLVLMARCVVMEEGCPADVTRFDCDGDGALRVDDVLCCATEVLRGPGCPNCPADTVRAAPEIAVRFGAARAVVGGLEVPLLIEGTGSIGASRLRIRFPSDRFMVSGVVARGRWDWVELHRTDGNELSLGLLAALGAIPAIGYTGDPLEVTLRLESLAGAEPGGTLALLDGDFSGRDGVKLRVDLGAPRLTLGSVGGVSL